MCLASNFIAKIVKANLSDIFLIVTTLLTNSEKHFLNVQISIITFFLYLMALKCFYQINVKIALSRNSCITYFKVFIK